MLNSLDATNLFNYEAELEMLGAILSDNGLLEHLPQLEADHFHSPAHRRLFEAIVRTVKAGKRADPITLKAEFNEDPGFAEAGGSAYLVAAVGAAISVVFPAEQSQYLIELAQRRALMEACEETALVLANIRDIPPAEMAVTLAGKFEAISRGFAAPVLKDNHEITEEILKGLDTANLPASTGLARLDRAMDGGLFPGKAYGFAAKKKVGKTILATTISHNLNEAGVRHLFICGEMSPQEVHQRNLARMVNCYPSAFRTREGRPSDFPSRIADAAVRSNRCTLYYSAPGLNFDALRRVVIASALQRGVKGIILDYWQLVGGKGRNQSTSEHLDEVAQWIADTCRKYGIWAVVMAQINQEGNTRGGEGIRLAFDQVYHLQGCGVPEDISQPVRWMEMMDTRYTVWGNIGSANEPGLLLNDRGPYFENAA